MTIYGDAADLQSAIDLLWTDTDKLSVDVHTKFNNDKLIIDIDNNYYSIEYSDKADLFRGITLLADKISADEKKLHIVQKRNFDTCGVMVDVSRNAVLTVESVKRLLVYMAKMGLNMLMLYTEDMYKMKKYPYFGYMRGAYTAEEMAEIVDYAEIFGIEVVPCIQTLAHQRKAIQWDYAKDFTDTDDILLVGEEKTYEYIEEMIKVSRKLFKSNRIHIGMDEAFNIGLGKYLRQNGYRERLDIILEHLDKVSKIVEKYGFKPIIWSDMLFRDERSEEVLGKLPKNLDLMYWDYWKTDEAEYDSRMKEHSKLGVKPMFAGGLHTWNSLSVKYDRVFATQKPALEACKKNNIKDVVATIWGDDGGECNVFAALLGLQLYAEYNYCGNDDNLTQNFNACTGYDAEAFKMLSLDRFDEDVCPNCDANVSKAVFYQDILEGLFDRNLQDYDFSSFYAEYIEKFDNIKTRGELKYLFDYYRKLLTLLQKKCDMGNRIYDAYARKDVNQLKKAAYELNDLRKSYEEVHSAMAEVWYHDNKPFGFEVLECRMGGVEARIKRAEIRITQYLNGEIDAIPELEEERLYFSGQETPFTSGGVRGLCWDGIFAAGPIKGA